MKNAVLVTGSSRGLGYRIAEKFAAEGHPLVLTARDPARLEESHNRLAQAYPSIEIARYAADLSRPESVDGLLRFIDSQSIDLDCLVNNAGVYAYKPFLDSSPEEIVSTVNLNLTSLILLTQGVVRRMIDRDSPAVGGKIVNIASDVAKRPLAKMSPYVATKYGLLGFARSLAQEFKRDRIYVSVLCPGMINNHENDSPDIEEGMLDPRRIAEIVYFVYRNNQNIVFDEVEFHPIFQEY